MSNEIRKKVASKESIKPAPISGFDLFGGGLKIPPHIKQELDEAGLVGRFVSLRKLNETGGHHPRGWTVYQIKNPQENPVTGQVENIYKYGDLVLAVKPKALHAQHKAYLEHRSQLQSSFFKNNVKEMRDRIRDSRADKHISLIEGYEENDGDE